MLGGGVVNVKVFRSTEDGPGLPSIIGGGVIDVEVFGVVPELPGDFDFSGVVDGHDFLLWQRDPSVGSLSDWEANYGMVAPLSATSTTVPEPSTLLLSTLAAVGLLMQRRLMD